MTLHGFRVIFFLVIPGLFGGIWKVFCTYLSRVSIALQNNTGRQLSIYMIPII